MRLLIISHFLPPDMEPSGFMFDQLSEYFALENIQTTTVSAFANFPLGRFYDKGRLELFRSTRGLHGLRSIKCLVFPSDNKSNFKRVLNYSTFFVSSIFASLIYKQKPQVIIATSPPLTSLLSGYILSVLTSSRLIVDIRDIWPQSAIELGSISNKYIIRILEKIEAYVYARAHYIVTATPGMANSLCETHSGLSHKITAIPCGVKCPTETEYQAFKQAESVLLPDHANSFNVIYAGLHGYAQNLSVILEAAQLLQSYHQINFHLFGDGPEKPLLLRKKSDMALKNLHFYDPLPRDSIRSVYTHASCALVPLKDEPVFKRVFPSKTFELLSFKVPTIVGVGGEISDLLSANGVALIANPDDPKSYADCILRLFESPDYVHSLIERGYRFVNDKMCYDSLNPRYLDILKGVLSK